MNHRKSRFCNTCICSNDSCSNIHHLLLNDSTQLSYSLSSDIAYSNENEYFVLLYSSDSALHCKLPQKLSFGRPCCWVLLLLLHNFISTTGTHLYSQAIHEYKDQWIVVLDAVYLYLPFFLHLQNLWNLFYLYSWKLLYLNLWNFFYFYMLNVFNSLNFIWNSMLYIFWILYNTL